MTRGVEGFVQFPVGLALGAGPLSSPRPGEPDEPADVATISWGHNDRETFVTQVPTARLVGLIRGL